MSALKGVLGSRKVRWKRPPVGVTGQGEVEVDGQAYAVAWRRDADGIWLEFPHGVFGYDLSGEPDDASGDLVYRIAGRSSNRVAYGLRVRGEGESAAGAAAGGKKRSARVRAQMPGKITRVLVKAGDEVAKDQPLFVMEAMKMENEIRAAVAGKIEVIKVSEGQAVETGADLALIG